MSFTETLRAAIADILEHGFDSAERIRKWMDALRVAAKLSLVPESELQRKLTDALTGVYKKALQPQGLLKRHIGISSYTIRQIEPKLRQELDIRILASASLIRLNREASIQRTLHRFEGWSTSIPKGGTRSELKRPLDEKLRRSFASLPFEERRVIIDQGHKLSNSLNAIVAQAGQAIAAVWHSHWRETGYDFRPRHKQFDQRVFVVRDNWALKDGLMKLGGRLYLDQIEEPAVLPFCRCQYAYLYTLADLPEDMLTAKAKMALHSVRQAVNS